MRKMKIIATIGFTAIFAGMLVLNSCTKQEDAGSVLDKQTQQPEITPEDMATFNKIMDFKKKVEYIKENPAYKSGEEISVDSAVWLLDATLNLSHAFISWESMSDFYQDSVFVNLPKNNGSVLIDDMLNAYEELKQKIANVCMAALGTDKELYIASLTKKQDNGNSITIKAYSTIGSKKPVPSWTPFDKGWLYGDLLGDCNGTPGYIGVADACTQLRDVTNNSRYYYINDQNMIYVTLPNEEPYVTIYSEDLYFVNDEDPFPEDNYYEHLLVYQNQAWTYHNCIEADEMNWYYQQLHDIVYNVIPNDPLKWPNAQNKTFIMIMSDLDPIYGTYGTKDFDYHFIRHQYKIEYRHAIPVGNTSAPVSITEN